jgi:uncharacterized protein YndB with AHSA1/START domain
MIVVKDEVVIRAALNDVFQCFWNPLVWTWITPHVKKIEMLEETACRQRFLMTVESNGQSHTVETNREAVPNASITYQQSRPPVFLRWHRGTWTFSSEPDGIRVSLVHEAEVNGSNLAMLGAETLEQAEVTVTHSLRANGNRTLLAVKQYLESTESVPAGRAPGEGQ